MGHCLQAVLILIISLLGATSHSETRFTLAVKGLSFISPDYESPQNNTFGFFGVTLRSSEKNLALFNVNADGFYSLGVSSLSYLNIRELYFSLPVNENSKFYFGRKRVQWSSLDTEFNLGFFQPQFRWNTLQPENQGLLGAFFNHQDSRWGLTLFASYFFLPDQAANYEIKDGKFEDSNPWFKAPPQNIKFQNQVLPIDYSIERPENTDVVFRPLIALQGRYGEKTGPFSQFAAAYKPSHQLALGYSGVLVTTRVKINIVPKVYNETVVAADFGYREEWGLLQLSVLHTKPENPSFENSSNIPIFVDSTTWGPRAVYNVGSWQFGLAFFDTYGGQVTEVGPDASPHRPSLSQRFLYRQAVQGLMKYSEIFLKRIKLETQIQYTSSDLNKFTLIHWKNKLNLKGPWAFWADVILIETADDGAMNMNSYRNLDQFWIGASYDL